MFYHIKFNYKMLDIPLGSIILNMKYDEMMKNDVITILSLIIFIQLNAKCLSKVISFSQAYTPDVGPVLLFYPQLKAVSYI